MWGNIGSPIVVCALPCWNLLVIWNKKWFLSSNSLKMVIYYWTFYFSHSTRLLAATTLRNVLGTKNLAEILFWVFDNIFYTWHLVRCIGCSISVFLRHKNLSSIRHYHNQQEQKIFTMWIWFSYFHFNLHKSILFNLKSGRIIFVASKIYVLMPIRIHQM